MSWATYGRNVCLRTLRGNTELYFNIRFVAFSDKHYDHTVPMTYKSCVLVTDHRIDVILKCTLTLDRMVVMFVLERYKSNVKVQFSITSVQWSVTNTHDLYVEGTEWS
jgi:hypothetical protein